MMNAPSKKPEAATLSSAMAGAFAEIEGATKAAVNPHFGKKYADLGAVLAAIKPALIAHNLFFMQKTEPSPDGVVVETVLHHTSGEFLSLGSLYVPADARNAQKFGSALSYARRYALLTAFGVPTEDDDGNAASAGSAPKADAVRNGNGHQARINADRDAPFPRGPAKNKTDLKEKGRVLWADVMACADKETLDILLIENASLVAQLKEGLPQWWNGGTRDGEPYEGLGQVIDKLMADFDGVAANGMDWRGNPVNAG